MSLVCLISTFSDTELIKYSFTLYRNNPFCCETFSMLYGVKNNHVTWLCSENYIQDKLDGTVRNIYNKLTILSIKIPNIKKKTRNFIFVG